MQGEVFMNSQMKSKITQKLFLSLVIVGVLINFAIQNVYACTSSPPMPWFNPSLALISTDLPSAAVEIKPTGDTLLLQNDSDSLLRVAINTSYPDKNGYYELSKGQSASLQVGYHDGLIIDHYLIAELDHRNVVADKRPTDVKVPSPQSATMHLIMDGQSYFIQLQISYALNPDYQPVTVLAVDSSCEGPLSGFFSQFNLPITGFMYVSSFVLILGIIVFLKLQRRKLNSKSNLDKN
jgi:hypothetical protein